MTLCRSAWAGSQRYGAAVWSGDIASTFEALRRQVRAGLNIGLSGIPWWTTDIGGFHGGDPRRPYFRELIVRWFQYGVFCPLFRLHGLRQPTTGWDCRRAQRGLVLRRRGVRDHPRAAVPARAAAALHHGADAAAAETGAPPMRPLFFDFPDDPACTTSEDQFMFGPDLLVAPVLEQGATSRPVYLPAGEWSMPGRANGADRRHDHDSRRAARDASRTRAAIGICCWRILQGGTDGPS